MHSINEYKRDITQLKMLYGISRQKQSLTVPNRKGPDILGQRTYGFEIGAIQSSCSIMGTQSGN